MRVKQPIILLSLFLLCFSACTQDNTKYIMFERPGYKFPYKLNLPDQTWKLPHSLFEISGLSFVDDNRLACVQDEKGIIYLFSLTDGKIESEIVFGDNGDYEGIEIVEKDAWVLQSKGSLIRVTDYQQKGAPVVKKYPTALSGKNDTEGLAYDPVSKSLLIACKEQPFTEGPIREDYRSVYSFSLESGLLQPEPFLLISVDSLRSTKNFKPSGIAIHPATGHIYIMGSVGKLLLVYDRNKELLAIVKLSPQLFPKPEGICFSPDGTLYISSEGAGGSGTILKFKPESQ